MRVLIILCLFLVNCSYTKSKVVEAIDVGAVISMDSLETSFNAGIKSQINTEKGSFTVRGNHSVLFGKKATLTIYDNGFRKLCIEGIERCLTLC
jgi:hypothetical protein